MADYQFDKFLKYDELVLWLKEIENRYRHVMKLSTYGKSYEGRDLWLVTITDNSTGVHNTKPAQWVDANIHSTETTAGVGACYLIHHLVTGFETKDPIVTQAMQTRTFYIVPRVNPDGVEAALADDPNYLRSSVRPWPWNGHKWPGFHQADIDKDGRVLSMRVADDHGAWVEHPEDSRVLIPVDHDSSPITKGILVPRFRSLREGLIENYDGFTIPTPAKTASLDLNRNFTAMWSKKITGSGDHPLSEVEIHSLVRALAERPNVCGYNAYHTSGGILLRPPSSRPDSDLPPIDLWVWKEMGRKGLEITDCPAHSCYDDFTFDKSDCMSGAADDFAYDHLGVFSWTTEFWDIIYAATGEHADTKVWYFGPTVSQELAVAKWADINAPGSYVHWYKFQHPQLGEVELGGPDYFRLKSNPPLHLLKSIVAPHAKFAVYQALLSPKLEILTASAEIVSPYFPTNDSSKLAQSVVNLTMNEPTINGDDGRSPRVRFSEAKVIPDRDDNLYIWKIKVGVANTGFLPTNVTAQAAKMNAVLPASVDIAPDNPDVDSFTTLDGSSPLRVTVGQLSGRLNSRVEWSGCDGTPERALSVWTVLAPRGTMIKTTAIHPRAGTATALISLI